MTRVLIVAKTRLWQHVCIGALSRDPVQHLRLLDKDGDKIHEEAGYEVGQIWEIRTTQPPQIDPPHVEDVCVKERNLIQTLNSLKLILRSMSEG